MHNYYIYNVLYYVYILSILDLVVYLLIASALLIVIPAAGGPLPILDCSGLNNSLFIISGLAFVTIMG